MKSQNKVSEERWEKELTSRIERIKTTSGEWKTMSPKDYIVAASIIVICLCAVVAGAFL